MASSPPVADVVTPPPPSAPPEHATEPRRRSFEPPPLDAAPRRRGWWVWLFLLALGGAGWYYWPELSPHVAPYIPALTGHAEAPKGKTGPRVTPVVAAPVTQRDLKLYLNALGTITALKTVTVRSRVEGELTNVAFTEGQMVRAGDLLAEIDTRPFEVQRDQAAGQLSRDEATLRTAKLTLTRYNQLLESKIASPQQIDEQLALVQQAEGAVKTDKAMIATAELQLSYCKIVAPISGRIGLRRVDKGNIVLPNDASGLAVITQLQPIGLVFTIPQDEIARVLRRHTAAQPLVVEAYDRDFRNLLATGKLLAIDNQVDPTNGTVRLKAEFDNADGLLFPNQFVNVRLLVETQAGATVAPSAAVQRGPNGTFVYVARADETVELRPVRIGPMEGADTAIEAGLNPGELVVTEGLDKLQPDAKITLRDPNAQREKGGGAGGPKKPGGGPRPPEGQPAEGSPPKDAAAPPKA